MKMKYFAIASAAALGVAAPVNAAVIVDVDGRNNSTVDSAINPAALKKVVLKQGRYVFSFVEGAYTSHNRFGGSVSGCTGGTDCLRGWETNVRWIFDGNSSVIGKLGNFTYHATEAAAFAASSAFTKEVTIGAGGQEVGFYIFDPQTNDNRGGVSIGIAAVPEPATWAMMIMGFGLIGGAYRSRRTQAKINFA
jgi:PEP-CTERM motif